MRHSNDQACQQERSGVVACSRLLVVEQYEDLQSRDRYGTIIVEKECLGIFGPLRASLLYETL